MDMIDLYFYILFYLIWNIYNAGLIQQQRLMWTFLTAHIVAIAGSSHSYYCGCVFVRHAEMNFSAHALIWNIERQPGKQSLSLPKLQHSVINTHMEPYAAFTHVDMGSHCESVLTPNTSSFKEDSMLQIWHIINSRSIFQVLSTISHRVYQSLNNSGVLILTCICFLYLEKKMCPNTPYSRPPHLF